MSIQRGISEPTKKQFNINALLDRWDVSFPLCAAVAFVAAYLFRTAIGPLSSLPFIFVCTFICAFFRIPLWQKCALFFVEPFFILLFQDNGLSYSMTYSALATVICLVMCLLVSAINKKETAKTVVCAVLALACLAAHLFFLGQPWDLFGKASKVSDYISENYGDEQLITAKPRYDYKTGDVVSYISYIKDPTVSSAIKLSDGKITDRYIAYTEKYIMRSAVSELTSVLRAAFPDGRFTVDAVGIMNYPRGDKVTASSRDGLEPYMCLNVCITEQLTKEQFITLAREYYDAVMRSNFYCGRLVFTCGGAEVLPAQISVPLIPVVNSFDKLFAPSDPFFNSYF